MSIFKPNLFEKFEIRGEWWLPGKPEEKVSGIIEYDSDSIILSTLGSVFGGDVPPFYSIREDHPNPIIINGLSHDGELITLLNCLEVASGWSTAGGTGTIRYSPKYLIRGENFSSLQDMTFESCFVNYSLLEEWVGKRAFETEFITENERIIGQRAAYSSEDSFDIVLPSIATRLILKHRTSNKGGDWFRTLGWEHAAWVKFAPDERRDFVWYRTNIFRFRNLLSLFIGVPIRMIAIELYQEAPRADTDYKPQVNLYFNQQRSGEERNVHPYNFIVRLRDILEELPSIVDSWFLKCDELQTVYEIFFATLYAENLYAHLHFLSLTQALETFHRSTRGGTYLPDADYERIRKSVVEAIPDATPSDLKASLKSRLKYGNEYAQRKRFNHLFHELEPACVKLVTDDSLAFVNSVVDTRNYLTHYTNELKANALDGAELYNANTRLRTLLIILLLKEIGISEQKISSLVERNSLLTKGWVREAEFSEPDISKSINRK